MKPLPLLAFSLVFLTLNCFGQAENLYDKYLKIAEEYFKNNEFKNAAENYTRAFLANKDRGRIDHRYQAARSWAMASVSDSAFYHLERIVNSGSYSDYVQLANDTVFSQLHEDNRWKSLLEKVALNKQKWDEVQKQRKEIADQKLNKPLASILDTIYFDDQNLRKELNRIIKDHGQNSEEVNNISKAIQQKDSVNLSRVRSILDRYGWLGSDEVGVQGNITLFLVIQHADLKTQEQYLPMLQNAVKQGKAHPSQLALLEDRIAIGNGRRQLYGSQIFQVNGRSYLAPLEDPDNVDKRRASMGLQPIAAYLKNFNMEWNVEKYKLELPEIETKASNVRKSRRR